MNSPASYSDDHADAGHPLNKKGLADLLGVSVFILNKMIDHVKGELGEPAGTIYSINQVRYMIQKFGKITQKEGKKNKDH